MTKIDLTGLLQRPARRFRRQTPPGSPPGTIVTDPEAPKPHIRLLTYSETELIERELRTVDELPQFLDQHRTVWVNVDGLGDAGVLERIGKQFGLHNLALEDVVHVHQRAKMEEYDDHLFVVARMVEDDGNSTDQLSMFVSNRFVLTFQERPGDCFDSIRDRIRRSHGRMRHTGHDYLAYAILDAVIDAYFPVLEAFHARIDEIEDQLEDNFTHEIVHDIHHLRNGLLQLRKSIWPHREMLNALLRDPSELISKETRIFLRDVYDHTVQLMDVAETQRELCADLREYYLSTVGTRANEVMRVLTIIATIFIPLGFIAGVYGMNFDTSASPYNMPELEWYFGYPFSLGLMVCVAAAMLLFFWRKGWLRF